MAGLLNFSPYDEILADCDGDEGILSERWFPVNGGEYYMQMPTSIEEA